MVNVWRLMAHHERDNDKHAAVLDWSIEHGLIAIGWPCLGNIHQYATPEAIVAEAQVQYPGLDNVPWCGEQLWNFCHVMDSGDLVILKSCHGYSHSVVMEIAPQGEYVPGPAPQPLPFAGFDYTNQREVRVRQEIEAGHLWQAAGGLPPNQRRYNALIQLNPIDV